LNQGEYVTGRCVPFNRGRNHWKATEARAGELTRRATPSSMHSWATSVEKYLKGCASAGVQIRILAGAVQLPAALRGSMSFREALSAARFPIRGQFVLSRSREATAQPATAVRRGREDETPDLSQNAQAGTKRQRFHRAAPQPPELAAEEQAKRSRRQERFATSAARPHGTENRQARPGPPRTAAGEVVSPPWTPRSPPIDIPPFKVEFKARTVRQTRYVDELTSEETDVVLAMGDSGAGKTCLAVQEGLRALRDSRSKYRKLIVTRPDRDGKVDERGLMELQRRTTLAVMDRLLGEGVWLQMHASGQLQFQPFKDTLGATFGEDTWVVADEMQNATFIQIKSLCKRFGGGKICITGDDEQCDLGKANECKRASISGPS